MAEWTHHNYEVNEWSVESRYYRGGVRQHSGQGGSNVFYTFQVETILYGLDEGPITGHAYTLHEATRLTEQAGLAQWLHAYVKHRSSLRDLNDNSLSDTAEAMLVRIQEHAYDSKVKDG